MELNARELDEMNNLERVIDAPIRELSDLELAIVGGGCGEIIVG